MEELADCRSKLGARRNLVAFRGQDRRFSEQEGDEDVCRISGGECHSRVLVSM